MKRKRIKPLKFEREMALRALSVDCQALPRVSYGQKARLPMEPGVYLAAVDSRIVYIGATCRLGSRWASHELIRYAKCVKRGWILYIEESDYGTQAALEHLLILMFKPKYNFKPVPKRWAFVLTYVGTALSK